MSPKKTYMPFNLAELERRYSSLDFSILDEPNNRTAMKGPSKKSQMEPSKKAELVKEIDNLIDLCEQTKASADRRAEQARVAETRSKLDTLMRAALGRFQTQGGNGTAHPTSNVKEKTE